MRILVGADVPPDPDSGAAGTVVSTNSALRSLGCMVDEFWARDLPHRIRHWNLHYWLELPGAYRDAVAHRCQHQEYDVIQLSQPHAWLAARDHRWRRRRGLLVNRSHGLESLADAALETWRSRLGIQRPRFPRSWLTPVLRRRLHRHIDLVAQYADGIIVPASDIREHLIAAHGADPSRVRVIHHGIPDAFLLRPRAPMTEGRLRRILHVAQYSPIKGAAFVVQAATRILEEAPEASLSWVCGRAGHDAVLAGFPAEVRDRVHMLEWRSQEALVDLYDQHGMHLAHSVYEGAAKAATEAMARGQVLVSSAVGALKEHVRNGENGYLVAVGDVDAMAVHALHAMRSPSLAAQIGSAAAVTAAALTWQRCAEGALDFYCFLGARR